MGEKSIFIDSEGLKIQGLLESLPGDKGAVVTHPHPLYGGEMHNNVVEAIVEAYRKKGYSTLRFNFRGAGGSQGSYDNGIGEQEDVRAALRYLSDLHKRVIDLAGYSFGAWVNALGLETFDQVNRVIMVSPPLNFVDFDFLSCNPKIQLVIVGDHDEIAGVKAIEEKLPVWNPEATLRIIHGTDHFYGGKTDELRSIIGEFLDDK
jgi:alpha/beta superfamily hydrolase